MMGTHIASTSARRDSYNLIRYMRRDVVFEHDRRA